MKLTIHPAADLFPMMSEDELKQLADDTRVRGQMESVVTWNEQVVDGRNRMAACEMVGRDPRTEEADFDSEAECVSYIIGANIHRRHLDTSQRAMIAAELAKLARGSNQHKQDVESSTSTMSQSQAAKAMGVSRESVVAARKVQQHDDLTAEVKAGKKTVSAAAKEARERERPERCECGKPAIGGAQDEYGETRPFCEDHDPNAPDPSPYKFQPTVMRDEQPDENQFHDDGDGTREQKPKLSKAQYAKKMAEEEGDQCSDMLREQVSDLRRRINVRFGKIIPILREYPCAAIKRFMEEEGVL